MCSDESIRVSEALKTFNDLASCCCSLIGAPEFKFQEARDHDDKSTGKDASGDTGNVGWSILDSENSDTNNATDPTGSD
jgi:hypothetical protein